MDVIIIFNGLGNQMSQYAFYVKKKSLNNHTYFIDFCSTSEHNGFELAKIFGLIEKKSLIYYLYRLIFRLLLTERIPIIFKPIRYVLGKFDVKIIKENFNYNFNDDFLSAHNGIHFYMGGWHHPDYYKGIEKIISDKYVFPDIVDAENLTIKSLIQNTNSVSMHIRRGDFYNSANIDRFGGVCELEYYLKAIKFIEDKVENPYFIIFSNDFEWVEHNIKVENYLFVKSNISDNSWKDMYLMSICKHNIIANSTFSWWGAWLNDYSEKIVVCPDKFIKGDDDSNIFPESWYKIKVNIA